MFARPEFSRPTVRRNEVPRDQAGHFPIRPRGPSWVGEGDPGLFDRQNGDLCHSPLKEG